MKKTREEGRGTITVKELKPIASRQFQYITTSPCLLNCILSFQGVIFRFMFDFEERRTPFLSSNGISSSSKHSRTRRKISGERLFVSLVHFSFLLVLLVYFGNAVLFSQATYSWRIQPVLSHHLIELFINFLVFSLGSWSQNELL